MTNGNFSSKLTKENQQSPLIKEKALFRETLKVMNVIIILNTSDLPTLKGRVFCGDTANILNISLNRCQFCKVQSLLFYNNNYATTRIN